MVECSVCLGNGYVHKESTEFFWTEVCENCNGTGEEAE